MENKNIKQKGIRTLIPCQNQSFEVYVSTHTQTHSLCSDLEQLSHNFTRQQDSWSPVPENISCPSARTQAATIHVIPGFITCTQITFLNCCCPRLLAVRCTPFCTDFVEYRNYLLVKLCSINWGHCMVKLCNTTTFTFRELHLDCEVFQWNYPQLLKLSIRHAVQLIKLPRSKLFFSRTALSLTAIHYEQSAFPPLTVWAEVLGFLHHVNSLARMEKPCCKRHFILRISTVCCTHSVWTAARKSHFQMLRTVNLLTKLTWKWQSRLLKAPMRWGSTVQYIQEALLGNATAGWVNEQSTGSKRSYNRTDSLAATQ